MCGIVGFSGKKKVIADLILGLTSLQHRGQDSAGIVTFKDMFRIKKGLGLVNEVFKEKHIHRLKGKIGIGHVRYTTHGTNNKGNAQPIVTNYPFGIAMVHNGNVTNYEKMNQALYHDYHVLPTSTNDLEILLYTFAAELEKKDLGHIAAEDILAAAQATQERVEGAYAVISVIANHGLLAFMDPNGLRPLLLGKKETDKGWVFGLASESVTFDHLGYEVIRDLQPGEILFIDNNQHIHSRIGHQKQRKFCIFEYIYFAREDSIIHDKLVAGKRVRMGQALAHKIQAAGLQPDIVIDVPSSGYFAASGLAEELGIPHHRGLVKSNYIGRSFISPKQSEREAIVKRKLNPIKNTVRDKKIVVVDDSIVRGTTSKRIVKLLRQAGAKEIYFASAAPPIKHPCIYGIDMSISTELIAANKTLEAIKDFIEADALFYNTAEDLDHIFANFSTCTACYTGNYPTDNAQAALKHIERERLLDKKGCS